MDKVEARITEIRKRRMKTSDAITVKDLLTMRRTVELNTLKRERKMRVKMVKTVVKMVKKITTRKRSQTIQKTSKTS